MAVIVSKIGVLGRIHRAVATIAVAALFSGCGANESPIEPLVDPLLEPFVGTWDATELTVRSVGDTTLVVDILANGASYILIEASGNYQSTVAFGATPFVEFGRMSVSEAFLTLRPSGSEPLTRDYQFTSADVVRLDGPSDWDFNKDGITDPATLFMEMRRR